MAELNWVPKEERLPTAEDACNAVDVLNNHIYVLTQNSIVACVHLNHFKTCMGSFTHWLPLREMPVPKRWRVPTIHDLAKAGKPIPCRVSNDPKAWWKEGQMLSMISVNPHDETKFWTVAHHGFQFCEICDE